MSRGTKLAAYALVLAAALGTGAAIGSAAGPIDVGGSDHGEPHREDGPTATTVGPHGDDHGDDHGAP